MAQMSQMTHLGFSVYGSNESNDSLQAHSFPFCFVTYSLSKQNINMTHNITPVSLPCLPEPGKMANK